MSIVARERPGVYSDYEASGVIYRNNSSRTVGIVAKSSAAIGKIYNISRISDAENIFGKVGIMFTLCEMALKNGAYKISAVSVGSSDTNYQDAFNLLSTVDDVCAVICDSESVLIQKLLKASVISASENLKERVGIVAAAKNETLSTWISNFNNERIILIAQNPIDDNNQTLSGCVLAAAIAGIISKNTDPSTSFNGIALEGISGLTGILSEDDVDDYIKKGITPVETINSKVEIIRAVTSKTTSNGVTDSTFKELNTILIIDFVLKEIRNTLSSNISGQKNNGATRSSIQSQATLKLQEFLEAQMIDSYSPVVVSQSKQDASICVVELTFTVVRGLNQIHITANITV